MSNAKIVRTGYNTIAAAYTESRAQDSADVTLLDELVVRLAGDALVLDAGCGAGVPVTKHLSRYARVVGVDFSEFQLGLARESVPAAQFLCQDLTALGFAAATFDAIVSYYAIIHIPREHHQSLFRDLYRILKPEGLALLCLGADDLPDDFEEDYFGVRMGWSHFDAATNLDLLRESSFSIVWSKLIDDVSSPGSAHLFVLAKKHSA